MKYIRSGLILAVTCYFGGWMSGLGFFMGYFIVDMIKKPTQQRGETVK